VDKLLEARDLADTEPDTALRIVNDVLNDDFNDPQGLFMAAYILMQAGKYGMAYNLFKRSGEHTGDHTQLYNNMGMCFGDEDNDEAVKCFDRSLELDPKNEKALSNKALTLLKNKDPKGAEKLCRQSVRIDPNLRAAHDNLGLSLLMQRKWKEGWKEFAWGLGGKHRKKLDYGVPDWDGKAKGNLVVYGEQGIGDEIMFASCIPDVLNDCNHLSIVCDSRLEGVFGRSFDAYVSGSRYDKGDNVNLPVMPDYQCSIADLPRFYRNKHKDFTGTSYLKADPERCIQWRALLDQHKGKKIGIAWTGGLPSTMKHRRSIDLETLAPLFETDNTFISLEYKQPDQELLDQYGIIHWDRAVSKGVDYDETLALINECDLIISVCTTVIYGAGALGKECWVLVPETPSYRYHLTGDFPWYKSVKLLRQEDTWEALVARIKAKLLKYS